MTPLPSIAGRLARALLGWSLVWALAVTGAVTLAVHHEVDELLDDTLRAQAEVLAGLLAAAAAEPGGTAAALPAVAAAVAGETRFAWQLAGPGGRLIGRSHEAPQEILAVTPSPGFHDAPGWRVYGLALGDGGRMLYAAQTRAERIEARLEVTLNAALVTFALGLLGHLWLGARVRHELAPLQALSMRLAAHDPARGALALGAAERAELQPVHAAVDGLAQRLAQRLEHERAFAAHAAHALRTPLAGIDVQLALLVRASPPELQPRLERVRDAAGRLQRVVAALLALFRSGTELQRAPVDLAALAARLPVAGLEVAVDGAAVLHADADLLAAALANLLDNAQRHGAHHARLGVPAPGTLRLHDDGPGVDAARRAALQRAIDDPSDAEGTGLGLRLADLVARAHGGALRLPEVDRGFAVEMALG